MKTFFKNYLIAYGFIWTVMIVLALFTQSNINAGEFGMYGFPVIALIYAFILHRINEKKKLESNNEYTEGLESEVKRLRKIIDHFNLEH